MASVEFAFLVLLLILIAAGLVEFGRGLAYYNALAKASRDAARYLTAVPGSQLATGVGEARQRVLDAATAAGVPGLRTDQITVTCLPTPCATFVKSGDISEVRVAVLYPVTLGALFPFMRPAQGRSVTLGPQATLPYLW